jgi:hypothetical protein
MPCCISAREVAGFIMAWVNLANTAGSLKAAALRVGSVIFAAQASGVVGVSEA